LFEVLKKRFTIKLILVVPDLDKKMKIEVNLSDCVTKGVFSIKYIDGR